MIEFAGACGEQLRMPDEQRGLPVRCPRCGSQLTASGGEQITADRPEDRPQRFGAAPENRHRDRRSPKSKGLHYTMIAVGTCALVGCVACLPLALAVSAIQHIRAAAVRMQSSNNAKQILLAMRNYHDTNGQLPLAYDLLDDSEGGPKKEGMSWRMAIVPYIEAGQVYYMYDKQQPWDSPSNKFLESVGCKSYRDPGDTSTPPTATDYQVFVTALGKEPHSMFNHPREPRPFVKLADATDGLQNTILLAEAPMSVPWYAPRDMTFDPDQPAPVLGQHHSAGSLVGLADGLVKFLPKSFSPTTLKQVITRDGREQIVDPNW